MQHVLIWVVKAGLGERLETGVGMQSSFTCQEAFVCMCVGARVCVCTESRICRRIYVCAVECAR